VVFSILFKKSKGKLLNKNALTSHLIELYNGAVVNELYSFIVWRRWTFTYTILNAIVKNEQWHALAAH